MGEKIHTRSIDISTFEEDDHIVVEGRLRDDRLVETYLISGEKHPPHTVHHMIIRMRIDCDSLTIRDIQVEMPAFPHQECDQTAESLEKLKGIRLVPGFTSQVKRLMGGKRGCLHLTTLILTMAPAILQGFWTHRSRTADNEPVSTEVIENYLTDTCRVWRKDGPLMKRLSDSLPKN